MTLTWGTLITALRAAGLLEEVKILEQYFAAPQVTERGGMAYVHAVMIVTIVQTVHCVISTPLGNIQ